MLQLILFMTFISMDLSLLNSGVGCLPLVKEANVDGVNKWSKVETNQHCNFVFDPLLTNEFRLSRGEIDFIFMVCRDAVHTKGKGAAMESIRLIDDTLANELLSNRFKEAEKRISTSIGSFKAPELHYIDSYNNKEDQHSSSPLFHRLE